MPGYIDWQAGIRKPCAGVNNIPLSGTMNLATGDGRVVGQDPNKTTAKTLGLSLYIPFKAGFFVTKALDDRLLGTV